MENQGSYAGANMNLAYMYAIVGKDQISFKYLDIAEPILKKTDNYFFLAMIEKIKAVNYFNLRDFENAIKYFKDEAIAKKRSTDITSQSREQRSKSAPKWDQSSSRICRQRQGAKRRSFHI